VLQRITTDGREVRGTARIGYTRSAWWLAVQVQAPAAERLQLIIGQTFLDDLEIWLFDGEQPLAPLYSGAKRSFSERGEPYPQFCSACHAWMTARTACCCAYRASRRSTCRCNWSAPNTASN